VLSIHQSLPRQNFEITNLPKFFLARILGYTESLVVEKFDELTCFEQ